MPCSSSRPRRPKVESSSSHRSLRRLLEPTIWCLAALLPIGASHAGLVDVKFVDVTTDCAANNGLWTVELVVEFDDPDDALFYVSVGLGPVQPFETVHAIPGPISQFPQTAATYAVLVNQCVGWDSFVTIGLDTLDGNAVAIDPLFAWTPTSLIGGWVNGLPPNGQGRAGNYSAGPVYPVLAARFTFDRNVQSNVTLPSVDIVFSFGGGGGGSAMAVWGLLTASAPPPPSVASCPTGVATSERAYRITGLPQGNSWSWRLVGPSVGVDIGDCCAPGFPLGGSQLDLAAHVAAQVNAKALALGCAAQELEASAGTALLPAGVNYPPGCGASPAPSGLLTIRLKDSSTTPTWTLFVGPACGPASCAVNNCATNCSINPFISEIPLSGMDCNDNGVDDVLDVLLGTSTDRDLNGILDECESGPCGPGAGSCDRSSGTPGCSDLVCCATVCSLDPFCCAVAWDSACVALAGAVCKAASPGDIDGDGIVDGVDLGLLLNAWGQPGPADINGDGIVDGADLGILLSNWSGG